MEWSVRIETVCPDDELGVGYKSAYDRFLSVWPTSRQWEASQRAVGRPGDL